VFMKVMQNRIDLRAMKEGSPSQLSPIDLQLLLMNELRLGHFAKHVYSCKLQFYVVPPNIKLSLHPLWVKA